ncbi:periostin [Euwallacea fornicatus]|uniref:periostin n=1 Tax=Euwallacea fornicatus TaxID=995702 RepID=UPI00338E3535
MMVFRMDAVVLGVFVATCLTDVRAVLQLPDTTGIDGHLTANHSVDHFFSLWLVFNNDDVKISDKPFTIFAPKNSQSNRAENLLRQPELVKRLLLDHVVLGTKLDLTNTIEDKISLPTLGGRLVTLRLEKLGNIKANNASVLEKNIEVPNGILIVVDSYLFPDEDPITMRDMSGQPTSSPPASNAKQANIKPLSAVLDTKEAGKNQSNTSFVENVMEVLSFLKSRVRVFQHFVSRSNVSRLLNEGEEYTVFVPTDHAFQRWHPIDWGFYPFSVPEFTESVIVNHFVKGRLKQDTIKDGQVVQTLGGKDIHFRRTPGLTVNGAAVVKGDTPVEKGNIMFIGEVLFVSESVVSKLHQQHRDKETPPLLAFPWFGAQFLSHAFLALERDKRFTHITRFLNLADLAPHVSGAGYTFFVPTDTAFEEVGLDKMPDNYLSNGEGLQILLNHFVKGRLYDKDLKDRAELTTLGNQTLFVNRTKDNVYINDAQIVESEVFVYNLGTMFYIDKVLYNTIKVPIMPIGGNINVKSTSNPEVSSKVTETSVNLGEFTSESDIESVTGELSEENDAEVLLGDGGKGGVELTTMGPAQNVSSPK